MSAVCLLPPHWKLMCMNRHFFSPFMCIFLLHYVETEQHCAYTEIFSFIHVCNSLALCGNRALVCMHRHFSVHSHAFFSCTAQKVSTIANVQIFFQPTTCVYLFNHVGTWKLSTIVYTAMFVTPHQWPTPSESIAIFCVRKLVSCVTHLSVLIQIILLFFRIILLFK